MHRIRRWAREKAHGRAPSTTEFHKQPSRQGTTASGSRSVAPSTRSSGITAGGNNFNSTRDDAATNTLDPSPSALDGGGIQGAKPKDDYKQKNVAARFGITLKDILFSNYLNVLLIFVPVGIAARFAHLSGGIIFAMNAIAIVPLAGLLSHATESVARRLGDTVGALLNVTFGNAVELIIFIIALVKNEIRIVQASLLGSILANLLLILGMCFLLGGLRFREQIYNSTVTQMSSCLLSLAVMSLLLPTAFHASFSNTDLADDKVLQVSRGTSVILLLVYALYLVFQLRSHAYMYESTPQHIIDQEMVPGPAANYFNSSSSDSSSSSSSDSDSSGRSRSTAKRIKRKIRRATTRKHSISSQSTGPSAEGSSTVEKVTSPDEPVSAQPSPEIVMVPSELVDTVPADDEGEGGSGAERQLKKDRKKRKHHKRRRSNGAVSSENNEQQKSVATPNLNPGIADTDGEPRRVDFAVSPSIEAQTETPQRPFLLRALRPTLPKTMSQNVFSQPPRPQHPPTVGPTAASSNGQGHRGPRRASSLPNFEQTQRLAPGAIPPIIPIIVNSHQRNQVTGDDSGGTGKPEDDEDEHNDISRTTAVVLLLVSTGLVALCAEFMVDAINDVVHEGSAVSEAFIGLILLPIVGNAAEHTTAVTVAMKNKMDLAIGVALGSSIQIAIFITPLVVILGWCMGKEMSLYFTLFETVSMFVSAFIVNFLVLDGRSNYLEGALLCCAYVIIAVAAFFYPNAEAANLLGGGSSDSHNATTTTTAAAVTAAATVAGRAVLETAAAFIGTS
ncbi:hypothetical protein MCOR25_003265 [Pyricularia grisea]|uniref:Sodium/calcium exchanger membrane region domain-containing protein n=1 Tax=Pyricularia grisea TaxID=148305 RepID=A0A6P8B3D9_PYRGI|nr:uncharacterized protein PgNI_07280 [Pyricularia grisea]KAI6374030.1 hypothetical protein MCOR25_003265 [Pyricularia grisea]TLD09357.1 hypothetical protein PgNI_07280 [Pyricularia grisea]